MLKPPKKYNKLMFILLSIMIILIICLSCYLYIRLQLQLMEQEFRLQSDDRVIRYKSEILQIFKYLLSIPSITLQIIIVERLQLIDLTYHTQIYQHYLQVATIPNFVFQLENFTISHNLYNKFFFVGALTFMGIFFVSPNVILSLLHAYTGKIFVFSMAYISHPSLAQGLYIIEILDRLETLVSNLIDHL